MLSKKLDLLEISDIQELIDNEVGEGKTIEYKKEIHIETGDERKEFLADISSFANADGGHIIYGVAENPETKLPSEICVIPIKNEDELIRKVENLIRDSIAPRIPEIHFKVISINSEKGILVIQISPSYLSPHRVIYKGHDKFYTRNAKGKYPMDVDELRQAFTLSDSLNKQIEAYKLERISAIATNRYRILEEDYPYFIMQCLPISSFRSRTLYSVKAISDTMIKVKSDAFGFYTNKQIIIDGIFMNGHRTRNSHEYKYAFAHYKTNGIIEKATISFFCPNFISSNISPPVKCNCIYNDLINDVITECNEVLIYYNDINVPTPIIISFAIMNGFGFTIPNGQWMDIFGSIDRDALFLPDILIEDLTIKPETFLKPVFDAIWNACGYTRCPAYDEVGKFIGVK